MGRSSILAIVFALLIVSATSNANRIFNSRKLVETQTNNSSSQQIPADEKEVNSSRVSDNKSQIERKKPENPEGSSDPPIPASGELNSTIINGGSSQIVEQKPKDPQVSNNAPNDSKDQNIATASPKAGNEQPKDPQGSNDPSKLDPSSSAIDGGRSKGEKEKPKDPLPRGSSDSQKLDLGGPRNSNATAENPSPVEKKENKEKKKVDDTINPEVNDNESCHGATIMCRVEQTLLACIQTAQNGSAEVFLVVQNEGEKRAEVNLNIQPPLDSSLQAFKIPQHQLRKINISSIAGKGAEIVVNSGDGSCGLQLDLSNSMENIRQQMSLYSKQVTLIHGVYFLFFVALLSGGMWACCKLRKKRHQDGVPYQELEMGMAESASAANDAAVTADGWDEDWDDDWDEENAVKSPGGRNYGNISANGLMSRSSKRDGWENDWDD